jgi:colanic acid biosynthesis protein WcaH
MKDTSTKKIKGFITNSEYYTCVKNLPIATVDVVIFNKEKNRTLLFRRLNEPAKGKYYILGGRINKNEKILDAALRKLKEEINLKINSQGLAYIGITEEFFPNSIFKKMKSNFIVMNYVLTLKNNLIEKLQLDSQHSGFRWFDIDDKSIPFYVKNKIKLTKNIRQND